MPNFNTEFLLPEVLESNRVLYQCSCGQLKTIHRIYFCRHCNEIRCRDCVLHEIDSQYCQNCLEYIPSMDAKMRKNKCAQCFECPSCQSTLTCKFNRSVAAANGTAAQVTKKSSYLVCLFCRWSTRDIGLPDQVSSTGVPDKPILNLERLDQLAEYYRKLGLRSKHESDKNKRINPRVSNPVYLLDKYGISSSLSAAGIASLRAKAKARTSAGMTTFDKVPELTEINSASVLTREQQLKMKEQVKEFYSKKSQDSVVFSDRTSMKQRLHQPERQPETLHEIYPVPKTLIVKKSLRCNKCDHNLLKPEYNPSVVKFKLQLSAYHQVPEIKLCKIQDFKMGETCQVEITLTNPTQYQQNVSLLPLDTSKNPAAEVILPNTVFQLPPKDDTGDMIMDLDSPSGDSKVPDDPNVVSFRRGNKIGVFLFITPFVQDRDCVVEFRLKHDYVATILPLPSSGDQKSKPTSEINWLTHTMRLNLGKIVS